MGNHKEARGAAYLMMYFVPDSVLVVLVIVCHAACSATAGCGERVDFARDIQPLLTEHCMRCHGGVRRAGGLRLIPAGGIPTAGDSGKSPLVPGKPDESDLFRRVTSSDPDERMPAESPPLSAPEIARLRQWIEEGAIWPRHWSLEPVKRYDVPNVSSGALARNAIDRFV